MNWRFWDTPERRETSLTDEVVRAILARAEGGVTLPNSTAVQEIAAGIWSRAFAAVKVEPETSQAAQALTPDVMAMIGRSLLTSGNSVWAVKVRDDEIRLDPVSDWTVTGEPDEATWEYVANRSGPSRQTTQKLTSARVVHIRIGTSPSNPWKGRGPLQIAASSASLAARIEEQLAEEASGPAGSVIPVPRASNTDDLATDLKGLRGKLALVDSTSSGWGEGRQAAPGAGQGDWRVQRLGFDPPLGVVGIKSGVAAQLLAAAGVPVALLGDATGTALREAVRVMLHSALVPVGRIALTELREKLDAPALAFDWSRLHATDLSGRARAFQSLVKGGLPVNEAAGLSGLLVD